MNILPIYTYDARVLRTRTRTVVKPDPEVTGLVLDMFATMKAAHGIGLAANQVGMGHSLFVVDLSDVEDYPDFTPLVLINPKIEDRWGDLVTAEEGCLSIPGVRDDVERPDFVHVRYRDANFVESELEADGLLARVIQHEFDHLQGIFFTDYLKGVKKKLVFPELNRIKQGDFTADYPVAALAEMEVVQG